MAAFGLIYVESLACIPPPPRRQSEFGRVGRCGPDLKISRAEDEYDKTTQYTLWFQPMFCPPNWTPSVFADLKRGGQEKGQEAVGVSVIHVVCWGPVEAGRGEGPYKAVYSIKFGIHHPSLSLPCCPSSLTGDTLRIVIDSLVDAGATPSPPPSSWADQSPSLPAGGTHQPTEMGHILLLLATGGTFIHNWYTSPERLLY